MDKTISLFWASLAPEDKRTIEHTLGISLDDYRTSIGKAAVLVEFYAAAQRQAELDDKKEFVDHFFDRFDQSATLVAELQGGLAEEAQGRRRELTDHVFDRLNRSAGLVAELQAILEGQDYDRREKLVDRFFGRLDQSVDSAAELRGSLMKETYGRGEELADRFLDVRDTPPSLPAATSRRSLPVVRDSYSPPQAMAQSRIETYRCPFGANVDVRSTIEDGIHYEQCTLAQNVRDSKIILKTDAMQRAGCPKASHFFKDRCVYINGDKLRV